MREKAKSKLCKNRTTPPRYVSKTYKQCRLNKKIKLYEKQEQSIKIEERGIARMNNKSVKIHPEGHIQATFNEERYFLQKGRLMVLFLVLLNSILTL